MPKKCCGHWIDFRWVAIRTWDFVRGGKSAPCPSRVTGGCKDCPKRRPRP